MIQVLSGQTLRGRGECRMPAAPAASCALCSGRTHTSIHNEYTGTPGIPARNGFNGFLRALPGDRACLPPSLAEYVARPPPKTRSTHYRAWSEVQQLAYDPRLLIL